MRDFARGLAEALVIIGAYVSLGLGLAFVMFQIAASDVPSRDAVELSISGGQLHTPVPVSSSVGVQASGPDFAENEDGR